MFKRKHAILAVILLFIILQTTDVSAIGASIGAAARSIICNMYSEINDVGGAVASVIVTVAAIRWTGSENDAGARKSAKDAIVHAIVGLIILSIINGLIGGVSGGDPIGSPCG